MPCWLATLILTVGGTIAIADGEPIQDWGKCCFLASTFGFLLIHSLSSSRTIGGTIICIALGGLALLGTMQIHTASYLELKAMGSNCGLAACAYLVLLPIGTRRILP